MSSRGHSNNNSSTKVQQMLKNRLRRYQSVGHSLDEAMFSEDSTGYPLVRANLPLSIRSTSYQHLLPPKKPNNEVVVSKVDA